METAPHCPAEEGLRELAQEGVLRKESSWHGPQELGRRDQQAEGIPSNLDGNKGSRKGLATLASFSNTSGEVSVMVTRDGLPNIGCWEYFPSQARAVGVSVLEAGRFSKNILAPL